MLDVRLAISVIGDEIGPSVAEMLSFCDENDVRRLDMRTIDGRNLLGMTLKEVDGVARQLISAGITVPTFVSPVLKWPAPGKAPAGSEVDFAFDPSICPTDDPLAHAFDVATVLGASRIRVFSFLRYPGFRPDNLLHAMGRLVDLAERHATTVELENEPVCNIGSCGELTSYFAARDEPSPWLRPLVDIGNSWSMGHPPSDDDFEALGPMVDLIRLKDRDFEAKCTVPLGDGNVPWTRELSRLLAHVTVPEVVATVETNVPQDSRNATAKSVAALRRIAGEIGVEVV
jgi:sugar phosphate isomerase/epimerase